MSHNLNFIEQLISKSIGMNNITMAFTLLLSLALGIIVGYERTYNGRAAGMRTYGLVAMASCALIMTFGHPEQWFNGHAIDVPESDPTRVIQGIVTGIGFLCGGVIVKDVFSITGLTTAASIWSCAVIGILVGLDFYIQAILYSLLQFCLMFILFQFEIVLPSKYALVIELEFNVKNTNCIDEVQGLLKQAHYEIIPGSISLTYSDHLSKLSLQAVSHQKKNNFTLVSIANQLSKISHINNVNLSFSRN